MNIYTNKNSLYSKGGAELQNKILKRFSMFDGVGYDLTDTSSYDEALEAAGLDYTAEKLKTYLEDGMEIPGYYATVKSDDHSKVLGMVSNQYTCVSNKDAFAVAEEMVNEGFGRYEVGGPAMGSRRSVDYARSFLTLRGDDFEIEDDIFHSFIVFNNSFDGSTGVRYRVICERVVCLNGMVRYLGGEKNQFDINIQHSKTALDKIQMANKIMKQRVNDIEMIKKEAAAFIAQGFTRAQFEKEIVPLVLKVKKVVENDKDRERGQERIDNMVAQLISAYDADDVQNYNNSAYKVLLALSDWETHSAPLRDTGNGHIYMNRILKGMEVTRAVAQYIANTHGIIVR